MMETNSCDYFWEYDSTQILNSQLKCIDGKWIFLHCSGAQHIIIDIL